MKSLNCALYLVLLFAIILPSTFANDETMMGTNTTLWSDILNGANYYSATSANITIYNAQAVMIVNNQPMTLLATGRYYYQFVPNSTGIFYTFTTFSNSTAVVATASSTFYVQENSDMLLAVMLGLIAIIIYFIYLGKDLMSKPVAVEENKNVQKWLNTETIGLFTYMVASWLVLGLFYLLDNITTGYSYSLFFDNLFIAFLWVIPLANVGYWIFFVTFKTTNSLKAGIRHRR